MTGMPTVTGGESARSRRVRSRRRRQPVGGVGRRATRGTPVGWAPPVPRGAKSEERRRSPRRRAHQEARVSRRTKFLAGGGVIALALAYMIYAGVTQSAVYFVTPGELQAAPVPGKQYRLGGMVLPGSLRWEPRTLDL